MVGTNMHFLAALVLIYLGITAMCSASLWYVGSFNGVALFPRQRHIMLAVTIALLAACCFIAVSEFPNGFSL
jgi:hypothetical protein